MPARHRSTAFRVYLLVVGAAGLIVVTLLTPRAIAAARHAPTAFWLFAALLLGSVLFLVMLGRRGEVREISISDTFAFALLLGWGMEPAVLAAAAASIVADAARRKPPAKLLFNAGQEALGFAAAGGAYHLLGGAQPFGTADVPGYAAAVLAFAAVNSVLVAPARHLQDGRSLARELRRGFLGDIPSTAMLFGMAPALLIVQRDVALLLLLPLPLAAVYLTWRADMHRHDAERAAQAARQVAEEQARLVEVEQALVRQLRHSDQLKDHLLATVSHELRTPIAGVLMVLSTLSRHGSTLDAEQRAEFIDMGLQQTWRLKELIEDLLLASRLQHSPPEQAHAGLVIDASSVARQAAEIGRLCHPGRTIAFDGDWPLPVRANRDTLLRVLRNLLDNAAKYAPRDTPIRVQASQLGGVVTIGVEDAGPGVPADEQDRVFEPFTQLDAGNTRRASGLGLGLYVARQLARAEGGDLIIRAPLGGDAGTRFELRLPLAEVQEQPPLPLVEPAPTANGAEARRAVTG